MWVCSPLETEQPGPSTATTSSSSWSCGIIMLIVRKKIIIVLTPGNMGISDAI